MLAIVGGTGRLPEMLAEARPDALRLAAEGVPFGSGRMPARRFRLERLGALVDDLRGAGVDQLVFAGGMRRPRLDPAQLDPFTQEALRRLSPGLGGGDDTLFRGVIDVFEGEGFRVAAAHELLPALLPGSGILTRRAPTEADRADAARGFAVLAALGPLDVGQGCVVAGGQVLAIETVGGTDWMLGTLAGEVPGRPPGGPAAGTFCKGVKPGQDRRIDVPTIGPGTVAAAAAARLGGIAIEAGGVIVLDLPATVAAADTADLFLWVRET